jgi:hypothetical protein
LLKVGLEASASALPGVRVPAPSLTELQPHFPRLELLALVGEGGMGAVYKARDKHLDRVVALKILTLRSEDGAQFDERFAREARAMARLSHPNIAAVYEHGKAGPWSFLVLEYVDGENLRRVLRTRSVSPAEALRWVGEICAALQYAHEQGVVHRDIKPENVLVDAKGRVKVVDFGLAKLLGGKPGEGTLTGSQQQLGTWHYMAPEQYERPQSVDHRADIYSLGVVLYELLTGQVPIGRFDPPSQKIAVDVRVDEVVLKALAREPEKRWQAAKDVQNQVDGLAKDAPRAVPASSGRSGRGWIYAAIAAGVLVLALGATLVVGWILVQPAPLATGYSSPLASLPDRTSHWGVGQLMLVGAPLLAGAVVLAIVGAVVIGRSRQRQRAEGAASSTSRPAWAVAVLVMGALMAGMLVLGCLSVLLWGRARSAGTLPVPPEILEAPAVPEGR